MENKKDWTLITGATSGIGYELAKVFAKNGHNIILVARSQDDLERIAKELSNEFHVEAIGFQKDLFNRNGAFEVYDFVKTSGLNVNILVNDAGQGQFGEFVETDISRELDIIQ